MAIPAQGFTFTWGDTALQEVQTLEFDLAAAAAQQQGRGFGNRRIQGTVRLASTSPAVLDSSQYLRSRTLTIVAPTPSGAVTVFSGSCQYDGVSVRASANEAVRFAYQFTLRSTVGLQALTTS